MPRSPTDPTTLTTTTSATATVQGPTIGSVTDVSDGASDDRGRDAGGHEPNPHPEWKLHPSTDGPPEPGDIVPSVE
jgi:hypothetical protein